jgi:hypothetical protein
MEATQCRSALQRRHASPKPEKRSRLTGYQPPGMKHKEITTPADFETDTVS